ncbi:MAG: metalloregulator ArsR/SmtB family transcription factor [Myxococcota bacterium]
MSASLDATFSALSDPIRLRIVRLLGEEPLRPSEIADAIDASRPTTSRHLKILRDAGLVEDAIVRDDARQRIYRLRREPFDGLREFVEEVEAFWSDQLLAFKAYAEGPAK